MLLRTPPDIKPSEITDKGVYLKRREFMKGAAALAATALAGCGPDSPPTARGPKLATRGGSALSISEELTPYEDVTTYNNFYEFGRNKTDPAKYSRSFTTRPWTVAVGGEVNKPKMYEIEDLLKLAPLEERIYRLRCIEAWSMVIPWIGYSLSVLIKQVEPTSRAKYVEFTTLLDVRQMPGQRRDVLKWPYIEGLRMDEAMHPLTLLCFGLYGEVLPNQNGAPIRVVVPWKYGIKSAKSLVRIRFVDKQPLTTWNRAGPHEYGFYSNVNPSVDHPRWSQANERRIGEFFKRPTLPFNGYADHVAQLYSGMDLRKHF
jgi:sulfoxide reductase catalytic subunit YedY